MYGMEWENKTTHRIIYIFFFLFFCKSALRNKF